MLQIVFLILFSVLSIWYFLFVRRRSVAPYVGTPKNDRHRAYDVLDLDPGDSFIELGCGKGDFLFDLAERGVYGTGIELSFPLYVTALLRSKLFYGGKVKILFGDLFRLDLSSYNRVYLYLMKRSYPALKNKFANELKSGSRVVVAGWPLDDTSPKHKIPKKGSGRFYRYDY